MTIFISHSNKDRNMALKLFQELTKLGITAWTYEQEIDSGTNIVSQVESELKSADFVLVLLSQNAAQSPWVKREYTCRLSDDLSNGRESIIPVRLDNSEIPYLLRSSKWVDFRTNFSDGFQQLAEHLLGIAPGAKQYQEMFVAAYLLLLIDQFQNGLWGASLEGAEQYYGHDKGDLGSISVSTWCSFAISHFTGSDVETPIQEFRKYLLSRRSQEGAFGMRRSLGTPLYPKEEIFEHTRHTATALNFFLRYDGYDDERVSKAFDYLLNNRTHKGLWTEYKPFNDKNVDPITVSNVIDTFERMSQAIQQKLIKNEGDEKRLIKLDEAIAVGLNYLFLDCRLRTSEGFWFHDERSALRILYQHTIDVLSNVTLACIRLTKYLHELGEIIDRIISIAMRYSGGIPSSPESNLPSLDVTSRLVLTAHHFSKFQHQIQTINNSLPKLCLKDRVMESGGANGWSTVLLLYDFPKVPIVSRNLERIKHVNRIAKKMKEEDPNKVELPPELYGYVDVDFVRNILYRRKGV